MSYGCIITDELGVLIHCGGPWDCSVCNEVMKSNLNRRGETIVPDEKKFQVFDGEEWLDTEI